MSLRNRPVPFLATVACNAALPAPSTHRTTLKPK